jgi:hypothetical protein
VSRSAVLVVAAAVVVSASAVVLAARSIDPIEAAPRTSQVVATSKATLSCPESPEDKTTETTLFAVAPTPPGGKAARQGGLVVSTLSAEDGQEVARSTSPGVPIVQALDPDLAPSVLLDGEGSLSQGLTAVQSSTTKGDLAAGIAASWCEPAGDEWWFSGVGTSVGSVSRLVVSNPTPALAVVDLTLYGPDGPVKAVGERGIALAPRSRESIDLAQFAPGLEATTVHVEASSGRVVAAVHTYLMDGASPGGTEWIAPSEDPAADVLLNAGFAGKGGQQLQITNPGEREAQVQVQVQVVDTAGPFTPSSLKSLRIPPGTVLTWDLTEVTEDSAAAFFLTSTVPVTGAVVDTSKGTPDIAVSSTSPELGDPSVVPVIDGTDLSLSFASAVREGGKVTIESFDAFGQSLASEDLNLRGFATTGWDLEQPRTAYLVVSVLVDGKTHAVAHYRAAGSITSLPVRPGILTVTRPDVRPAD